MLLWNFVKINCTSHLQDLEAKQNHFFIVKAQGKISVNAQERKRKYQTHILILGLY